MVNHLLRKLQNSDFLCRATARPLPPYPRHPFVFRRFHEYFTVTAILVIQATPGTEAPAIADMTSQKKALAKKQQAPSEQITSLFQFHNCSAPWRRTYSTVTDFARFRG